MTGAVHHDTLQLAKRLIACRSVTPDDGGAIQVVASRLAASGFRCERIVRGNVRNLWARRGTTPPIVCLAGHVDVVPPGPTERWTTDPFVAAERDGYLYGRGAADMKASVAAMVTAAERISSRLPPAGGSVAVLLTADEEGDAVDGTAAVVEKLRQRGDSLEACILGEPTSAERLGDTIKNGRRGSLSGTLRVNGMQCHIAYPDRGRNPIHDALPVLSVLSTTAWDQGNEHFPPTTFQISNVHAGAGAPNIIPGTLEVLFNFRFSPESPADTLQARVKQVLDAYSIDHTLEWTLSASPFLTPPGPLLDALSASVRGVTGLTPRLSTDGGTSDGRFLTQVAREVVEFGPVNESIHKIDERMALADLAPLSTIFERTVSMLLALPDAVE